MSNPANPFVFAMGQNVYQTKNYFIGAYHYIQCYGTELVVPSNTAEVAQALAHYYKRSQVTAGVSGGMLCRQPLGRGRHTAA